eukprot:GEMP01021305.1.p1 GENE.GEMP01021305.1~~GEMP01021305.1.p1  ORF type:complete len:654 (+),score=169.78 GEMP01021305.1:147-2108(+)
MSAWILTLVSWMSWARVAHNSQRVLDIGDPLHGGQRDLVWHDERLVFSEIRSETHAMSGHAPLYPVNVNLDIEAFESSVGVSMMFDKQAHAMRLDEGLATADGLAWGHYVDQIANTGWSELYINTAANAAASNDVLTYAAGYVEGILTCVRLSQFYANNHVLLINDEMSHHSLMQIKKMLQNEVVFLKAKSNIVPHLMSEEPKDPYWKHTRYLLFQLWGLLDGYNFAAAHFNVHTLTLVDMLLLNSNAEIQDLMEAYAPLALSDRIQAQSTPMVFLQKRDHRIGVTRQNITNAEDPLSDANWERRVRRTGHCSAFVRINEGNADLFVGHTTWGDFSEMTRIFKYYNFPLLGAETAANLIAMSSYPGMISSGDEWYMMGSGLVVMDTTLEILDPSLYDKVQDFPVNAHIPNFIHIMVCNRLARSASHWAELFETAVNTGTYNAQWMIVDYNNFVQHQRVADNTLWVVESIPGALQKEDVTHVLRKQRYWASFNRPYFDKIRDLSGHTSAQKSHGSLYSYYDNPRATIFRTAGNSVDSLYDMRTLMNRNMYPFAGVSLNDPGHEVSARMDLSPLQPIPNGGIDAKVTNRCLFNQQQCQAISGPTHANQRVFKWKEGDKEVFPGWPHVGLPQSWSFDFVQMTPAGLLQPIVDISDC